jgi:hypothetical protein
MSKYTQTVDQQRASCLDYLDCATPDVGAALEAMLLADPADPYLFLANHFHQLSGQADQPLIAAEPVAAVPPPSSPSQTSKGDNSSWALYQSPKKKLADEGRIDLPLADTTKDKLRRFFNVFSNDDTSIVIDDLHDVCLFFWSPEREPLLREVQDLVKSMQKQNGLVVFSAWVNVMGRVAEKKLARFYALFGVV